jgi:hypothetical protein
VDSRLLGNDIKVRSSGPMLIIGIGPGCFLYGFVTSGYNAGMRGGKQSMYEGGHRVPCFIRWPDGQIGSRPGRDVEQLTAHFDLFPTLNALNHLVISLAGTVSSF